MMRLILAALAIFFLPQVATGNEASAKPELTLHERLEALGFMEEPQWCTAPQAGDYTPIPVSDQVITLAIAKPTISACTEESDS